MKFEIGSTFYRILRQEQFPQRWSFIMKYTMFFNFVIRNLLETTVLSF